MAKKDEIKEKKQKTSYFKEMKAELKKVVWPTPKELVKSTGAVLLFVIIIAVIVFVSDFCFDNLNKYGITKLQEKVKSSFQVTDNSENTDSENASSEESTEGEADENTSAENSEAEVVVDGETNSEQQENADNTGETESNE